MLLDTDFLIDFDGENQGGRSRGAQSFLTAHTGAAFMISLVSWMEFAEGASLDEEETCRDFLSGFQLLHPDVETAWHASRISRQLKSKGQHIGDHDCWIAATALQYQI